MDPLGFPDKKLLEVSAGQKGPPLELNTTNIHGFEKTGPVVAALLEQCHDRLSVGRVFPLGHEFFGDLVTPIRSWLHDPPQTFVNCALRKLLQRLR